MRLKFVALIFAFGLTALQAKTLQATVTRVADGDTLWVAADAKAAPIKLRLYGIDAPEFCQPWGKQARDALRAKLLRQQVTLTTHARDSYGRSIASVTHHNQSVAAWLVAQGHAWSAPGRWDEGPYAKEQSAARKSQLGLWQQSGGDEAIEPREWRKVRGSCKSSSIDLKSSQIH
jgi:micrococcal nuclease